MKSQELTEMLHIHMYILKKYTGILVTNQTLQGELDDYSV